MGELALVFAVATGTVLVVLGHLAEPPDEPTWVVRWFLRRSRPTLGVIVITVSAVEGLLLEQFWLKGVVVALRSGPLALTTIFIMSIVAVGIGVSLGRALVEAHYSPFSTE